MSVELADYKKNYMKKKLGCFNSTCKRGRKTAYFSILKKKSSKLFKKYKPLKKK